MPLLQSDNLFQKFGIVLFLLASIGMISFTSKFIFGMGRIKSYNPSDQIFDPDHGRNVTRVCPFTTDAYRICYNRTVCFNKTLHYRYIPWMHFEVWRKFNLINEEHKIKRLRETVNMNDEKNEERNETKSDNITDETVVPTEIPANRKEKDEPSKVVCTLLAALLVISSAVAFCEVIKDKVLKTPPKDAKQRFSFSDSPTKEQVPVAQRQGPFQTTAKVTQTLVHQTSLDRAFSRLSSEGVKPLFRRSSVPGQMMSSGISGGNNMSSISRGYPFGYIQQTTSNSSDSPEMRRKSRHFIRRH